ncbi:hypothetical protein [Streptomyces sp. WELS2]|uniref:hypothetical protein n=1 Tax=Streptomyces sp. WELS2 TaxID=2749435 RepID=UPI0015F0C79A|nr:hypothetical protein [Streptomyces sp. WELS2]
MTCFLEYPDDFDAYTVVVRDLIHTRDPASGDWSLNAHSYRKPRLSHAWVLEQFPAPGCGWRTSAAGRGGMRTVVLRRAS